MDGEYVPVGRPVEERPRCLACGNLIDAAPEGETFRRRGVFAIVVQWRICSCGAFARTQRVRRLVRAEGQPAFGAPGTPLTGTSTPGR